MINKEHYWPISIALFLTCFVAFLISVVLFMFSVPVNLVDRNYYQSAVNYQERLDQQERAAASNHLHWSFDNATCKGTLETNEEILTGRITFRRPSNEFQDFSYPIELNKEQQSILLDLNHAQKGLWLLEIEWSSKDGTKYFHSERLVIRDAA